MRLIGHPIEKQAANSPTASRRKHRQVSDLGFIDQQQCDDKAKHLPVP